MSILKVNYLPYHPLKIIVVESLSFFERIQGNICGLIHYHVGHSGNL